MDPHLSGTMSVTKDPEVGARAILHPFALKVVASQQAL